MGMKILNREFYYNSVTLNRELHIAANFIYDALDLVFINNNDYKQLDEPEFNILYNLSVGIERFQKISIVLSQNISSQEELDKSKYIKQLMKHNHKNLNEIIDDLNIITTDFTENEKKLIILLMDFYRECRYGNYKFTSMGDDTKKLVFNKLNRIYGDNTKYNSDNIFMHLQIVRLMNKIIPIIGSIVKKYHDVITKITSDKNIYTNESQSDTKYSVLTYYGNNILMHFKLKEYSKLEFLFYLQNQGYQNINPLDFDKAHIEDYINLMSGHTTCSRLIDECSHELSELYQIENNDENEDFIRKIIERNSMIKEYFYEA